MVEVKNRSDKKKGQIDHSPRGPAEGWTPALPSAQALQPSLSDLFIPFFVRSLLDIHHLCSSICKKKKRNFQKLESGAHLR